MRLALETQQKEVGMLFLGSKIAQGGWTRERETWGVDAKDVGMLGSEIMPTGEQQGLVCLEWAAVVKANGDVYAT